MVIYFTHPPQVFPEKKRRLFLLANSKGQGVVELVLILVVAVSIILAVMNQFYKPFGRWATNYMGEYLQCLLETGELPSLGGEGASGECNQSFDRASFSSGRTAKGSTLAGENSSVDKSKGKGDASSNSGGGGSSRGADSRGGLDRFPSSPKAATAENEGGGRTKEGPDASSSQFANRRGGVAFQRDKEKKIKASGLTDFLNRQREKKESEDRKLSRTIASESGGARPKKIALKSKKETSALVETAQSEYSLGSLFRIFLIIIILIIMLVFFGGQALQISKSWEK